MSSSLLLQDRVYIVTGGASGMSLSTAERLAQSGANVAICDVNEKAGEEAVNKLSQAHPKGKFMFRKVDVSDYDAVERFVQEVASKFERIDGLVNGAGIARPTPRLHEIDLEVFRLTVNINLFGTVHFNKAVLAQMMKQNERGLEAPKGGYTIVNIGSKGAVAGLPSAPSYTAAKHGVLGLTRVVAKDYAKDNIRCNCICPGLIWSPMLKSLTESGKPELSAETLLKECFTGRFGQPEEMANIMHWMSGPESSYYTGQALEADGAWAT